MTCFYSRVQCAVTVNCISISKSTSIDTSITLSYIYVHLSNGFPAEDGDILRGGDLHLGWYRPGGAERSAQDDRRRHHRGRAHRRAPRPGQPLQQVADIYKIYDV